MSGGGGVTGRKEPDGIDGVFAELKARGKKGFIPYLTAGDPSLEATELFVKALARAGSSVIELGVPFSDPLADGVVNQRAAARALRAGATLARVLGMVAALRAGGMSVPLVLFTYFNPIHSRGVERFAEEARRAGVDGVLCVDLPPEESVEYRRILGRHGLSTIFLAAPTTRPDRLGLIDEVSTGFVYYVSRAGVTGARPSLPETLLLELMEARKRIRKPLAVGFGISGPGQAREIARHADAVVVGSAIVRLIEEASSVGEAELRVEEFARSLVEAIERWEGPEGPEGRTG